MPVIVYLYMWLPRFDLDSRPVQTWGPVGSPLFNKNLYLLVAIMYVVIYQCQLVRRLLVSFWVVSTQNDTCMIPLSSNKLFYQTQFWATWTWMASRRRCTPHNVYTQKRADQQFQDFLQYSKSKNLPIPDGLTSGSSSSSEQFQAIDRNHPNAPKRQRLAPGQVNYDFLLFFQSSLIMILFVSSLSWIQQAQIQMETKLFSLSMTSQLMTSLRTWMETNTPHFLTVDTIPIQVIVLTPIRNVFDHPH